MAPRTGLHALESIDAASGATLGLANMVSAMPAGPRRQYAESQLVNLGRNLSALEAASQQHLAAAIRSPMVAADRTQVGGWSDAVRRQSGIQGRLELVPAPDFIEPSAHKIVQDATNVAYWIQTGTVPSSPLATAPNAPGGATMSGGAQTSVGVAVPSGAPPVGGPMGSPIGVVGGAVMRAAAQNPLAATRMLGGIMSVASFIGTGWMAWFTYKDEKKRKGQGIDLDETDDPLFIRQSAQKMLEEEIPGATVTLSSTPDGEWVSAVKRGRETISRVTSRKPQQAAGEAAKRAMEYMDAKSIPVEAVKIDTEA